MNIHQHARYPSDPLRLGGPPIGGGHQQDALSGLPLARTSTQFRCTSPPARHQQEAGERAMNAAHLAPIRAALASGQVKGGSWFPGDRPVPWRVMDGPAVILIGDDLAVSRGPTAFHQGSLKRMLKRASHIAIMAGMPIEIPYRAAPLAAAASGKLVLLIECQETTEAQWHAWVRRWAPKAALLTVTPRAVRPC
jgi:hypothetical protein